MISFVFSSWIINEFHKYYLKHEAEYFRSDKTRTVILGRKWRIFPCVIQINTKFANCFVGLYFPHFMNISQQNVAILIDVTCSF
jgi:hypothetical protein